jgi:hypothetical protein
MDAVNFVNALWPIVVALVGGLAWLFKLQGDVRVLRERVTGQGKLHDELREFVHGSQSEIREKLDYIIEQLGRKADR